MSTRSILGFVLVIIGVAFLVGINIGPFIMPAVLIFLGIIILTGRGQFDHRPGQQEVSQNSLNEVLVFSGTEKKVLSDDFNGGKVITVFGGGEIDLRGVKTKEKVLYLELVAVFGGLKLYVPDNWLVTSNAVAILGGIDNKTVSEKKAVELKINGSAVFGGIEIRN